MGKIRRNFTLEEGSFRFLRSKGNMSDYLDSLLLREELQETGKLSPGRLDEQQRHHEASERRRKAKEALIEDTQIMFKTLGQDIQEELHNRGIEGMREWVSVLYPLRKAGKIITFADLSPTPKRETPDPGQTHVNPAAPSRKPKGNTDKCTTASNETILSC